MKPTWTRDVIDYLATWLPEPASRIVVALLLIVIGLAAAWILAKIAGLVLRRLTAYALRFLGSSAAQGAADDGDASAEDLERSSTRVIERVVFWFVFVFFLAGATSLLGFPIISKWLQGLAGYLPRALAAVAVLLLGFLSARLIRTIVQATLRRTGFTQAEGLGQLVHVLVILVAAVVAVDELGVEVTFVIVIATTAMAVMLGGASLAFGLGARETVRNLMAAHYLSRTFRVGVQVRIDQHEGRIADIQSTTVLLDTKDGQLYLPAKLFQDSACIVLNEDVE